MKNKIGIPPIKIKDIEVKCELFNGRQFGARYLYVKGSNYSSLEIGVVDEETGIHEAIVLTKNKNAKKIIDVLKSYQKQNKWWK